MYNPANAPTEEKTAMLVKPFLEVRKSTGKNEVKDIPGEIQKKVCILLNTRKPTPCSRLSSHVELLVPKKACALAPAFLVVVEFITSLPCGFSDVL